MHTVYGTEYIPLLARVEQGHSGRMIAKLPLPNGNEQLCFLDDDGRHQDGTTIEVMITGVVHPMHNGRRDRRKVIALRVREITGSDVLMGIDGFVKANDRDKPTALGFESDGEMMTQATATNILDQRSLRPLSMGAIARQTRVLTPGSTGAAYVKEGSRAYRDGSLRILGATNVWAARRVIESPGRTAVSIVGLTRVEDLDAARLLEGRPSGRVRKAA